MHNLRSTVLAFSLSLGLPLYAAANPVPDDFDVNPRDGLLSPLEQAAFKRALDQNPSDESDTYQLELEVFQIEEGPNASMPVNDFSTYTPPRKCDHSGKFFLRASVIDRVLVQCDPFADPSGARFSLTHNGRNNQTDFSVLGGLMFVFAYDRLTGRESNTRDGVGLTEYAFGAFLDSQATFSSGGADTGWLRGGLNAGGVWAGGPVLEKFTVSSALYYQTDANFDATGYGLKLNATPQITQIRLGGAARRNDPGKEVPRYWYWTFDGSLDGFQSDDPGQTRLAANEGYLWAEAGLGLVYVNETFGAHGMKFEAGVSYAEDMLGSDSTTYGEARVDLFLDEAKTTSLALGYRKGQTYQTLEEVDETTFSLSLRF